MLQFQNTEKVCNFSSHKGELVSKLSALEGFTSDQDTRALSSMDPAGGSAPYPSYRLTLRARHAEQPIGQLGLLVIIF